VAERLAARLFSGLEVPRDLLLGRYPAFVTGGPLPRGDVPVFVFHSLEPEPFRRKLEHLSRNGYVTLGADDYYQGLTGAKPFPERAVVLTFDDGRGSLWSVGGPLLKRFGMRGIVFLVPGRMRPEEGGLGETLDDVERGRAGPSALAARESGPAAFLTWAEAAALKRDSVFDFESHTATHARVHVGPELAGFLTPDLQQGYAALDVPLLREGDSDRLPEAALLGTPLLRSAPRTSEALRFFEEPRIREACTAEVREGGGAAFFRRPGWRERLQARFATEVVRGRLETPAEREQAIRRELQDARVMIADRLGRPADHLCYPWHVSGATSGRLVRETGYRAAYWGKVPGVPVTRAGGDLYRVARIGEDYVELLPGRGRASLLEVLRRKWTRRVSGA
jgi:peptidoglycan/xylan/chitin deacetylase (PgdA/CDA1 family)